MGDGVTMRPEIAGSGLGQECESPQTKKMAGPEGQVDRPNISPKDMKDHRSPNQKMDRVLGFVQPAKICPRHQRR